VKNPEAGASNTPIAFLANDEPLLAKAWHPVARSQEVGERPIRATLLGEHWVLLRLEGRLVAFKDACPHRGCPLSIGEANGKTIQCAYHGWSFDASGRCVGIPALGPGAALPPMAVLHEPAALAEELGLVWLAPERPLNHLPEVPEAYDASFMRGDLLPRRARCSAGMMMDNFLDFAHFPFVHKNTFGADESALIEDYHVDPSESKAHGFRLTYSHTFSNREDPAVVTGERPLIQRRTMTYEYSPPFSARLRLDFLDAGGTDTVVLFVQPETSDTCRLYSSIYRNDLGGSEERLADAVAFETAILEEDLRIQEAIDDLRLPLVLNHEAHTRADRITIELRRSLSSFLTEAQVPDGERGATR